MQDLLERWVPGLSWRALWLSSLSAVLLVLFYHHGARSDAPDWFLDGSRALSGIANKGFHRHGWSHLSALVLLMVVPAGIVYAAMGMTPREMGLRIKGSGKEFLLVVVMWLAFIPVIWWASTTESFAQTYPRLKAAETDATMFVLYQAYYLVKWTAWEFFFRGFMLFSLRKDLGGNAILLSTLPFVIMHIGKPELEMLGSLPAGLILCTIALRSKSIWPGVFIHSMVATTMDFFASSWW